VAEKRVEVPCEGGRFDGMAVRAGEDEVAVHPFRPRPGASPVTVFAERGDAGAGEGDPAF
jgi:hypothetical protein